MSSKIYLAGIPGGGWVKGELKFNSLWTNRLWSYHYIKTDKNIMSTTNKKVKLFLDSGAYSAWTQGSKIDIQEYIQFIKENKNVIPVYANLDSIGSPEGTWKNQMIMEEAGLTPMPVFHYGEDPKWLKRILSKKYEYIALGGMVPISTKDLMSWLDMLWSTYLTDDQGMPVCKVHGFGLTSFPLMMRYPWYSVDSTSWVVTGRMGGIYIPKWKNGAWIYDENCWKIAVSNKSPNLKEVGQHFQTLKKMEQEIVLRYLAEKGATMGSSSFRMENQDYELKEGEKWSSKKPKEKTEQREVETILEPGVSNMYQLRGELNIIYFMDLEKQMPKYPWKFSLKKSTNIQSFF